MKKTFLSLIFVCCFASCTEEIEYNKRELIVTAYFKLHESSEYKQVTQNNSSIQCSYDVYVYAGEIEITDAILEHPLTKSKYTSIDMFFKVIENGKYTILVDAEATEYSQFTGYHTYKKKAYTYVEYPEVVGKSFYFDLFNLNSYSKDGITYLPSDL